MLDYKLLILYNRRQESRGKIMKKVMKFLLGAIGIIAGIFILFIVIIMLISDKMLESSGSSEDSNPGISNQSMKNSDDADDIDNMADTDYKSATVMVYIIGSDLESEGGCASDDIDEILKADLGRDVNVVIQTGGAYYWKNPQINAKTCQRFSAQEGNLVLEEDLGLINTADPDTLSDFIRWTAENYAADRYGLILWDHGGGTIMGFGADEYFEDEGLELQDMQQALYDGGVHMDFVGFDACLMGTVEVAYALEPYADYLIGSEEIEPGTGWYYTNWLTMLGENPGINTEKLGKKIVDDYVNGPDSSFWDDLTMAVIRLDEIPKLYDVLRNYLRESRVELRSDNYDTYAAARSGTRAYGRGEFEQVDIADFIQRVDEDGGEEVLSMLQKAIAYADSNITGSNGLSMYFPYVHPELYEYTTNIMESIGMEDTGYLGFFDDFVNIMIYGQDAAGDHLSPLEELTGYSNEGEENSYENTSWYDPEIGAQYAGTLETLNTGELYLKEKGDHYVLSLSDEEWSMISYMELQVYLDDGEGYLDLGCDNVYTWDEDGDLLVDFDYSWIALNGQIVPFYAEKEGTRVNGSWYTYGYVPAELNGNNIEILLYWDDEHDGGYVAGYRPSSDGELTFPERNLSQFEDGDNIYFYCDYYTYDGDYDASYYLGDPVIYRSTKGLLVSYEDIDMSYDALIYYHLKDLYRNDYWTESIAYTNK